MSLKLIDSVNSILDLVRKTTDKEIEFIEKNDLSTYASIKIARKDMPKHLVFYKKEHDEIINHLIAHECGHILRIYTEKKEKRLMPISNDKTKARALEEMEDDINKLAPILSLEKLTQILDIWYQGIIRQLTNYPSDIQIEKWLYDDYPELRSYQKESIEKQQSEAVGGLSEDVRKITPEKIYDASNIMNYAFFRILGFHFGVNLVKPYSNAHYLAQGKKLATITEESYSSNSYGGDIEMVNIWAEFLGLGNWHEWTDFEELPENYLQSF